jgi:hypothetical protein
VTPHLTQGPIATTDDERIANVLTAIKSEVGDVADLARWALENWQAARAGLVAVREVAQESGLAAGVRAELLEIVADGLDVAES